MLEIADVRPVVNSAEDLSHLLAEQGDQLRTVPHEELPFHAFAVGVLRASKIRLRD